MGYLVSRLAVVQLVFNRRHRGPVPLPQPLDEFDVLLGPRAYAARGEERREQLIHPTPLDARDGPRRGERHLDRKRRERGEMVDERDGEDGGSLGARLRHSRRHRRERETRHQTHPPVFRFNRCWRATVQDFFRPELPELPAGPWLVSIDAPDGYTGWDDRTGRVRRPNPTRVRDARRRLVCPHRTSAGGARPRYVVECFFFFSPELSCRRTQPHPVPSGERLGSTRKLIHFWFYFGSGCSPGCMGGDLLSLCRVRRDTAFACDLIMHKHTTSATCLPCVYVHPPCILPGGAGERQ